MLPLIRDFRYRPEIDGLRALAVLAVVFFHARMGVPGGYIGVDVFFVISGYLITSLILNDLQRGTFTLAGFWERRARRIIPALAAVVLATLIAGWFLLLPRDYAALGRSAACQSVFAANFHFWRVNICGYFAGASDEMPLLHTWSLAVEEQFYLIVPLSLAALFRFPGLWTQRVLLALIGGGILASLFAGQYVLGSHPVAAFYLLPARAWELLLGCGLAILPITATTDHRATREIASCIGLAGIVIPCFLYTEKTPFPGLAALPSCLGAALVVWGNSRLTQDSDSAPTTLGKLLATGPVVFIGLISYSLYLWHWPILAFAKYYSPEPYTPLAKVAMITFSFVLAILSWLFIEKPFRRKTCCVKRATMFKFAAATLACSLTLGLGVNTLHGLPQRFPKALQDALTKDPQEDFLFARDMTTEDVAAGKLQVFGARDSKQPVSVLVWGDSHAMAALPAFDAVLKAKGLVGRAATHGSTAPVVGYLLEAPWGLAKDAPRFNEEVLSYIKKERIPHVVLVSCWRKYIPNATGTLESALSNTVARIVSLGSQPWIVLDVPGAGCDLAKVLRRATLINLNERRLCTKPGPWNGIIGTDSLLLDQLTKTGARIIDPRPAFLNSSQDVYLNELDGVVLYRDVNHLTKKGAEKALLPLFEKALSPFLSASLRKPVVTSGLDPRVQLSNIQ